MDRAPPTPSFLLSLSPDYSLSPTSSLFVFDLELQALLANGRFDVCVFWCLSHLWWTGKLKNGGSSAVFGKRSKTTTRKRSMVNLWEDKAEISGVWCNLKPLPLCFFPFFFREWIQSLKGFFQEFLLFFKLWKGGSQYWPHCVKLSIFILSLAKENLPQS